MYRIFILFVLLLLITNCNSQKVVKNSMAPHIKTQLDSLKNVAVFTTKNVINKQILITRVYHDEDGSWQFFDDLSTNSNENIMIVRFGHIVQRDSSVINLLSMPASHFAQRKSANEAWEISQFKESED